MLILSNKTRRISKCTVAMSIALALSFYPAPAFSQNTDTNKDTTTDQVTDTQPDRDSQPDQAHNKPGDRPHMRQGRNGFGKPMARGGARFLAGSYDLKIEIKPGSDLEPLRVLVDGEPVDAGTAAFFLRIIRQKKMRAWKNHNRTGGPTPPQTTTDHAPTPAPNNLRESDFEQGRASSSPERIDEVMSVIRDFDPNLYSRLLQWQRIENNPGFAQEIDRLSVEYAGEIRLKQRDQDAYALRVKDRQIDTDLQTLQFEIGMTQPKDEDSIHEYQQKIKALLSDKFDIQQKMRDRELAKMTARLNGLKERLTKRAAEKDRYIDERTKEIFNDLLQKDQ